MDAPQHHELTTPLQSSKPHHLQHPPTTHNSPDTPDQWPAKSRAADGGLMTAPSSAASSGGDDDDTDSVPPNDSVLPYSKQQEEDAVYLGTNGEEEEQEEDVYAKLDAALTSKLSLETEVAILRGELSRQTADLTHRLEAEHQWCSATVQQATDVACLLRDANVHLTAENDMLRARVDQLEAEAAEFDALPSEDASMMNEGTEQLIAALQLDIGDLQRQLHKAQRGRIAASETEDAALQRAEMLQQQVEQMVALLDRERDEREKLEEAILKSAVALGNIY